MGAYDPGKYIMGIRPLRNEWRFGIVLQTLKNRHWLYVKWINGNSTTQSIIGRDRIRPATSKEIIEAGISQL